MSREMRVGIAILAAIVFLGTLVFISGGRSLRQQGYKLEVEFVDAMGLSRGAPVLVSGIEAGRVSDLRLLDRGVLVELEIREGMSIPVDSGFSIDMGGLLGEPRVNVKRGISEDYMKPGDKGKGEIPPTFDEVFAGAIQSLEEIESTFRSVKDFLSDLSKTTVKVETFLSDAGNSVKEASLSIQQLTRHIDAVIEENRENLSATVSKLRDFSVRLDGMTKRFEEEGPSGKDVKSAIQRVDVAAREMESMAVSIRRFMEGEGEEGPPFTMEDVNVLLEKTDRIMSYLDDIEVRADLAVHGVSSGFSESDAVLDSYFLFKRKNSPYSLLLGAQDIGDRHGSTAAIGYTTDFARFWAGAVHGYAGTGLAFNDEFSRGPVSVSAQWWDESGGSWSAESRFKIGESWGVFYKYQDRDPEERQSVGLFYRF